MHGVICDFLIGSRKCEMHGVISDFLIGSRKCEMHGVICNFLIGSRKFLQFKSVIPSDWSKRLNFSLCDCSLLHLPVRQ